MAMATNKELDNKDKQMLPSIRMANYPPPGRPIITPGSLLPYGQRLADAKTMELIRFRDFAQHKRIVVVGVIGAYTPSCWNLHLKQALEIMGPWCSPAENGEVCIVATNDCYCLKKWGEHLQLPEQVRLFSDITGKFTRIIGMDICVDKLGQNVVRSRRYILQADNMLVRQVAVASDDEDCNSFSITCCHINHHKPILQVTASARSTQPN